MTMPWFSNLRQKHSFLLEFSSIRKLWQLYNSYFYKWNKRRPGELQAGQLHLGSEQPGLAENIPAHGRGVGAKWPLKSLPTQNILWPYDLKWKQIVLGFTGIFFMEDLQSYRKKNPLIYKPLPQSELTEDVTTTCEVFSTELFNEFTFLCLIPCSSRLTLSCGHLI